MHTVYLTSAPEHGGGTGPEGLPVACIEQYISLASQSGPEAEGELGGNMEGDTHIHFWD